MAPDGHPTRFVRPHLDSLGVITAAELRTAEAERNVAVAGVVTHRQRPATAGGTMFINLEDETGLINIVCSLGCWTRYRVVARRAPALLVRGRLDARAFAGSVLGWSMRAEINGPRRDLAFWDAILRFSAYASALEEVLAIVPAGAHVVHIGTGLGLAPVLAARRSLHQVARQRRAGEGAYEVLVPEHALGQALRRHRLVEVLRPVDAAHALAAAAGRGLHKYREHVGSAGQHRNPCLLGEVLRFHLQRHRPDRVRCRSDPRQPGLQHGLREVGVLGQESVTRVDRVHADPVRRTQDLLRVEV